jgi:hypothetical protein
MNMADANKALIEMLNKALELEHSARIGGVKPATACWKRIYRKQLIISRNF